MHQFQGESGLLMLDVGGSFMESMGGIVQMVHLLSNVAECVHKRIAFAPISDYRKWLIL
ncbi:hypothetical protein BACI349Y_550017 [Bacillus sp. 349Y]|nr:hypothetical protein BACI349Y_550017 [Bacillus sp. 349Y]